MVGASERRLGQREHSFATHQWFPGAALALSGYGSPRDAAVPDTGEELDGNAADERQTEAYEG